MLSSVLAIFDRIRRRELSHVRGAHGGTPLMKTNISLTGSLCKKPVEVPDGTGKLQVLNVVAILAFVYTLLSAENGASHT